MIKNRCVQLIIQLLDKIHYIVKSNNPVEILSGNNLTMSMSTNNK